MAVTYGFYNSLNKDRMYNAEQMSSIFNGIITDGVFSTVGDALMTVAGSGMQVAVKTGRAWFNSTWTLNDALLPLDISDSDIALTRIDAIILEVNSATATRANSIKVLKGTASANPTKPTLSATETLHQYALAYVTVNAGATSITAANIEINVGKTSCPFITSILQQTDIMDLFNKWEAEFNAWFADIQSQLSGDVAANLLNKINQKVDISSKATDDDVTTGADDSKWVTPKGCTALRKDISNKLFSVGDIKLSQAKNVSDIWKECDGSYLNANAAPLNTLNGIVSGASSEFKFRDVTPFSSNAACICTSERIVTIYRDGTAVKESIYDIETGTVRTVIIDDDAGNSLYTTQIHVINGLWMYAEVYSRNSNYNQWYLHLRYSANLGESWSSVLVENTASNIFIDVQDLQWDETNSRYLIHAIRNGIPVTYYGTFAQSPWSRTTGGFALWNTGRSQYIKFISEKTSDGYHALYSYTTTNINDDGSTVSADTKHQLDKSSVSSDRYGEYTVDGVQVGYTTANSVCFQIRFTHNISSSTKDTKRILMNHNWFLIQDFTDYEMRMPDISAKGSILLKKDDVCEMIVNYDGGAASAIKKISIPGLTALTECVFGYDTNSWMEISETTAIYITAPEGENNKTVKIPEISAVNDAQYYIKIAEET